MRMKEGSGSSAALAIESEIPATEDKELVLAFKRGEDGSYQAIYERYSPRVSGICRRMLNQAQDAEEAQQETFMRVYTSLPKFNGRYQLGAWVSRIATNVCLDHIRSKGRKPADSATHEMLVDLSVGPEENGPEEELLKSDERQKVREVLATLSPSHRAALALREFEGMSYDDIAVALNMTEPQVKALIHRARKAFKKQWAPGLAAFLPWRLIARARKLSSHYDAPPQVGEAAASTMHFASSCSVALQQCGQFVSERVVTSMTALVVGTVAIGAAVAPSGGSTPNPPAIERQLVTEASEVGGRPTKRAEAPKTRHKKRTSVILTASDEASSPAPEPQSSAEPAAQPTTAPQPEPTATPVQNSPSEPKRPMGPAPLYTYFGWEGANAIPRAQATSSTLDADCANRTASHEVQTTISNGALSYPMSLQIEMLPTVARLRFTVYKDHRDFVYSSWGQDPTATWTQEGSRAQVEITGQYGPVHGYDPESENLPRSGTLDATLTLDCAAQTVVTEGATFTAE